MAHKILNTTENVFVSLTIAYVLSYPWISLSQSAFVV